MSTCSHPPLPDQATDRLFLTLGLPNSKYILGGTMWRFNRWFGGRKTFVLVPSECSIPYSYFRLFLTIYNSPPFVTCAISLHCISKGNVFYIPNPQNSPSYPLTLPSPPHPYFRIFRVFMDTFLCIYLFYCVSLCIYILNRFYFDCFFEVERSAAGIGK